MITTENLETQETPIEDESNAEEIEVSEEIQEEGETETESEEEQGEDEAQAEPDPRDEKIAQLEAKLQREVGRYGTKSGQAKLLARLVKEVTEEGMLDIEEKARELGMKPEQLNGILNGVDVADNPIEYQNQTFDKLYYQNGGKKLLDRVMGEDTEKYVRAFGRYGFSDESVLEEYQGTDESELIAFVVERGKELLSDFEDVNKSPRELARENKALKAELAKMKGEEAPKKSVSNGGQREQAVSSPAVARQRSVDPIAAKFGW